MFYTPASQENALSALLHTGAPELDDPCFPTLTRRRLGHALAALGLMGAAGQPASPATPDPVRASTCGGQRCPDQPPDLVLITTDDMNASDFAALPRTHALLAEQGTTFPNYFLTSPSCSPSRVNVLRGQYAHNSGVRSNRGEFGGWKAFTESGASQSTIATWLHDAGYRTAHIGKHLNGYSRAAGNDLRPGWDEWVVPMPVDYFDYTLSLGATTEEHGHAPEDYLTDVLAAKAAAFITSTPADQPLFLYFTPKAPHLPSVPAPRHAGAFANHSLDTAGAFNEADLSDKPQALQREPLTTDEIAALEQQERGRLESLLAVDEAVAGILAALQEAGRLAAAYIVFTSDNGWLMGQHRYVGKGVPYEEAIRVPMLVRGPGVPAGVTNPSLVANIDLAPTFADLASVPAPDFVDGRSLTEAFAGGASGREALLIEIFGSGEAARPTKQGKEKATKKDRKANDSAADSAADAGEEDARDPFRAIRTADWLYVEYGIPVTGSEMYDLQADPNEMTNLAGDPTHAATETDLAAWLATLVDCAADTCRQAENAPPP